MGTLMAKARKNAAKHSSWNVESKPNSRSVSRLKAPSQPWPVRRLERERGRQDRHQHQQRPDQGVEHELHRGVDAVGATPDADDEVHRHQDDLPEDVEQEQVQGQEHAQHAHLEREEGDHVFLDARLDGPEGRQDADPGEQRGEDHQQQADAVHAHLVVDAEERDPGHLLLELEPRVIDVEAQDRDERQHERDQGGAQGDRLHGPDVVAGYERQDEGAHEWREDDEREDGDAGQRDHQRVVRKMMLTAMAMSPAAMPRA